MKKYKFSKDSIIKLSKNSGVNSMSKDCIVFINEIIKEKMEDLINMIILVNNRKIYTKKDISLAINYLSRDL